MSADAMLPGAGAKPDFDVIVIGAGPAGLSLAGSLANGGLRIALIERLKRPVLEAPPFDGREIAMTHQSIANLHSLGAWERIPAEDISPLHEARVINGPFPQALRFQPSGSGDTRQDLGCLVPNHQIRRVLFESVADLDGITLLDGRTATGIETSVDGAALMLDGGTRLTARLIVAADTRFSEMRQRMGIPTQMRDFGKTMLVCRIAHDKPHHSVATEWFGYGQTIAMLPLNSTAETPHLSSLVLTLPAVQIERMMALDAEAFGTEITRRYQKRKGTMRLVSSRHSYPLVGVYADRFVGRRFALVGDAAVGMHPVTAHGFNLGIGGAFILAELVKQAAASGKDVGGPALLARYDARHRRATRPLYLATNATVLLYTDDRFPARVMRDAIIRAGGLLSPVRQAISTHLMSGGASPPTPSLSKPPSALNETAVQ